MSAISIKPPRANELTRLFDGAKLVISPEPFLFGSSGLDHDQW